MFPIENTVDRAFTTNTTFVYLAGWCKGNIPGFAPGAAGSIPAPAPIEGGFTVFWFLAVAVVFLVWLFCQASKYRNPYTLTFIFGKKGAGKSCYMVREMLRLQKAGWLIYTDMSDIKIPDVRIINHKDLVVFRPEEHSALFLDEVGISMDNRDYKSFPPGLRDFFKYLRKMKCRCYMNSQAYDVDKKVRDTVDNMILQTSLFGVFSVSRPIIRSITLTEATGLADSRIADNLRFGSFFTFRIYYMPKYFKYFNSLEMPQRGLILYVSPTETIAVQRKTVWWYLDRIRTWFRH